MNVLRRTASLAGLSLLAAPLLARAQAYPTRAIRMVVAFPPGGITDGFARNLATGLSRRLGQPVVVENRVGGNSIPATQHVHASPPDGYTLYFTFSHTYALVPQVYKSLPYDPAAYAPVALVGEMPLGIQVAADSPWRSLQELIAHARAQPGRQSHGSPTAVSQSRLAADLFKAAVGIDALHVPFNGGAPLIQALLARQVDWTLTDISSSMPMIQAGRVRVLGVAMPRRLAVLPDVPTLEEAGVTGLRIPPVWMGVLAPERTPAAVVARLYEEIRQVMATPEIASFLQSFTLEPLVAGPDAMRAAIDNDIRVWGAVIRRVGLVAEQ